MCIRDRIIDMSSISPLATKEVATAAFEKGVEMIDAPVSGGEPKAINGTLSIMVGGKKEVFHKCYEILTKTVSYTHLDVYKRQNMVSQKKTVAFCLARCLFIIGPNM